MELRDEEGTSNLADGIARVGKAAEVFEAESFGSRGLTIQRKHCSFARHQPQLKVKTKIVPSPGEEKGHGTTSTRWCIPLGDTHQG